MFFRRNLGLFACGLLIFTAACRPAGPPAANNYTMDEHSFARPGEAVATHLDLDIQVDFKQKIISGTASWEIGAAGEADEIVFDTKDLHIEKVTYADGSPAPFTLGDEQPWLGTPLTITLGKGTTRLHIQYRTNPDAAALQWLDPQQTAGKKHPFLFTQSQAILARSWIPCQDSPGIRFTYTARVQVPPELMALMSAENPQERSGEGLYTFRQERPLPAYLMALAAGDLEFRSLGRDTGVYAEPSMISESAYEFADMQEMMDAAEALYGGYRWGRYDVIVLPPSFPFGGMENPELTFATPTIIAGDRSLVSLVAHELAHSWSGNLVTNATWNDFWLNEGFTVYFERRIMEALEGRSYAGMLSLTGFQDLQRTLDELGRTDHDTRLKLDLAGRDPDQGVTEIAYEKGFCLLRVMESAVGRERFDAFLKKYFAEHAFMSLTTEAFLDYYHRELIRGDKDLASRINAEAWIYKPGLPENCPEFTSERFAAVDAAAGRWKQGTPAGDLEVGHWSTHEWLHFIRILPAGITPVQMKELDDAFSFTTSGNSEILGAWFILAARQQYEQAYFAMEAFLIRVGRRKFLTPIYKALVQTPQGKARARAIYTKARPNYHFVTRQTMDEVFQ